MRRIYAGIAVAAVLSGLGPAFAQDANQPSMKELLTTVEALKARLKDQGNRLAEVEGKTAESQKVDKAELEKTIKELVADANKKSSAPRWLDNLKFYGDVRLRYEGQVFEDDNRADIRDRNRFRYRLRFGFVKTWLDDQLETGFQLASGEYKSGYDGLGNEPTSTNQTFDQDFSKKPVWIDLVYAAYRPKCCPGLEVVGGKMKNPLVSTDMVWDTDVNPEGFYAGYRHKFGIFEPFAGVAFFITDEEAAYHDSTVVAYQAGTKVDICKDLKYTIAATLYDWDHYYESENLLGSTGKGTGKLTGGNQGPGDPGNGFQVLNLTQFLDFRLLDQPWRAYVDFAHNCDNETDNAGFTNAQNAYAVGLTVGQNKKAGDWSIGYAYKHIEANAVPSAFADSDFGFTNRKGHVLRGTYNISDFLTLGASLYVTQPIERESATKTKDDNDTTVQIDLVWKL